MQLFDQVKHDVVYTIRGLRREPGLAAGIALTFALAIGANAAMAGLVGRLLLAAPPGVSDAARVARITLAYTGSDGDRFENTATSYPAFQALGALNGFEGVAAVSAESLTVGRGAELGEVTAVEATGAYFSVLGVRPALGRFFTTNDDELPSGSPVVVLSHAFWERQYDGSKTVLGQEVILDGQPYTIVGVAPTGFSGDELSPVDVFVPMSAAFRKKEANWWTIRDINMVRIIARLRNDVPPAAVAAQATTAMRDVLQRRQVQPTVELESLLPGKAARESPSAKTAIWLSGVSFVVLLIATANVGALLLLRALRRRREVAVRIALGAGPARLAGQLLTESLLLATLGGALGLVLSHWLSEVIRLTLLPGLAPSERFVDAGVLVATGTAVCIAGLAAGLAPLLQALQPALLADLHAVGRGGGRRSLAQAVLVGIQVALCTVLLVGAGLFVRSLERVRAQDLGFSTSRLLFVTLDFKGTHLPGKERDRVHNDAVARLQGLRGVARATVIQATPFGSHNIPPISVPGMSEPPSAGQQLPIMYGATPDYLAMMNVSLRDGRLFTDRDVRGSPNVVLVNESMARGVWPGERAVGKCIRVGFEPGGEPSPLAPTTLPCREVVGVVRDSRARSLRPVGHEARLMQYYVPFGQLPDPFFGDGHFASGILVQTAGDPERMAAAVQRAIQASSSATVYARVRPYQDLLDPQLRPWQLGATLFSAFGGLALGIAAVGLFGVVSYLVTQRTREIGVRLALGGSRSKVGGLVFGGAVRMVGVGVAVGLAAAIAAGPFVQDMLFQTSARELTILGGAAVALVVVAIVASAIPAWRASRVSPLVALRAE